MTKHNLMEAHKQFIRLSEGYLATDLSEDDPNQNPQDQMQGQDMPPMGNEEPGLEGQGQMPDPGMDAGTGQGQPEGEMPTAGDEMQGTGQIPDLDEPGPVGDDMLEPEEEGDDVLDVEDLTDAQEKLNKKQNELGHDLGDVDNRIVALLTAVEKIQGTIDKNSGEINDLKAEIERRMPTKTEKLNMQSLNMYPYNVSPKDYWTQKEKEGVYQAEHDSQEDNLKKQFEITQQDVDDFTDREMEDSFDDNEKYRQTMKDIFKGF